MTSLDPFRLGFDAARLGFRLSLGAARLPLRIVSALLGHDGHQPVDTPKAPDEPEMRPPQPQAPDEPQPRQAAPARPAPTVSAPPAMPEAAAPATPSVEPDEPIHIDDEPELVGEFSESGAEEGVGAEIHVQEPWDGYRHAKVAEVRERIASADMAELAVIQLYESANRKRKSVLDAVERRSKRLANDANAANAASNGH